MLTIRRKYAIVLAIVFGLAMISFNLVMNKFFYQSFKEYISTDMKQNYEVSAKNLDDYIVINNMNKSDLIIEDLNDKAMLDIESRDGRVFGKLSYSIYGKDNNPIGVLVLIKDYSDELLRNTSTKNLINLIVGILFALIFISVY